MFTKSQFLAAILFVASATSVLGAPMYNDAAEIEARADASPKAHGESNGLNTPTGGKSRQQKIKETAEILGAGKGNNGVHKDGTAPPNNSPSGSPAPSRESSTSSLNTRAFFGFLADLEARADAAKAAYGEGEGWITPAGSGRTRQQKVKQTAEILAIEKHKETEPGHPAVATGNTAAVHDTFHSSYRGPVHATVKYKNPEGGHVTTLHIGKDGERQRGNPAVHKEGTAAPNNSPVRRSSDSSLKARAILEYIEELEARSPGTHHGAAKGMSGTVAPPNSPVLGPSPGHGSSVLPLKPRGIDVQARSPGTHHGAAKGTSGTVAPPNSPVLGPSPGHGSSVLPLKPRGIEGRTHHEIGKGPSGVAATPDTPGPVSAGRKSTVKGRELLEFIRRELEFYDELD